MSNEVVHSSNTPALVGRTDRRNGAVDRRRAPRLGQSGRRATDAARAGLLVVLCSLVASGVAAAAEQGVKFGVDANSAKRARQLGIPVTYGSLWAGAWNQERYDWGGIKDQLETARSLGVTPVIQWWYWGDDLSPGCIEQGCKDRYHGVWKDKATWDRLSSELADVIVGALGERSGAIIVVETEFNKGSMQRHETFDAWLAEKAHFFRSRGLRVVIGFGNWGREHWKNYDRAVAAADLIGAQILYSSVRNEAEYLSGADMLVSAARYNRATFGKPTFVTDVAFSSYPAPAYERYQDTVIRDIFARMDELREAGVHGMVWRMLADDPKFDTANYHGLAERHWGLLRADGTPKPAFESFRIGVHAEAGLQTTAAGTAAVVAAAARR